MAFNNQNLNKNKIKDLGFNSALFISAPKLKEKEISSNSSENTPDQNKINELNIASINNLLSKDLLKKLEAESPFDFEKSIVFLNSNLENFRKKKLNFSKSYNDYNNNLYKGNNFYYSNFNYKSTNCNKKKRTHSFNSFFSKKHLMKINDIVQLKTNLNSVDDKQFINKNKIEFLSKINN